MCDKYSPVMFTLVAIFSFLHLATAAEPMKNSDCLECHSDKTLVKTNTAGRAISLFVDEAVYAASVHKTNACISCHADIKKTHPDDELAAKPVDCASCHERQSQSYGASVHGRGVAAGHAEAASCRDCHGAHDVLPPTSPNSPLHYTRLSKTCGECHPEAAADVQESVHGQAAAKGIRETATCLDCHQEHQIETLKSSSPLRIAEQICSKCHASERINTKYRLPGDRVQTFFESYHGLAAQYGSTSAANCASCHGVHKILASTDPRSTIHPNHLVETCGKCHPGATDYFAQGKIHVSAAAAGDARNLGDRVNFWVRKIYLVLIFGTIGFMLVHNGLAWLKKALAARRNVPRTVVRLDTAQRWQHLVLLVSFIILAVTGFALRYPDSWISWLLGGSEDLRRWSHRVAGVVLLLVGVYHIWYLAAVRSGRQLFKDMLPTLKDVTDFFANLMYLFGLRKEKARFARFGYPEKMEYWAVVWGTVIMGVTGLMIWFKMDVTHWVPRWMVDVATTIHYYEAILACLAIVVWHFYHVMFDPDTYPINWAWLDGKMSEHQYREEHPLDPALKKQAKAKSAPIEEPAGKDH